MSVGKDEKEPQFIQGCIDALVTFDETKRDQTHYKQIIKDSYGYVLSKHSKVSQGYFLHCHHPELAMNMKLLDLTSDAVVRMPDEMSQASGSECEAEDKAPKEAEILLDRNNVYIVLSGDVYMKRSLESACSPGRSPLWPRS